MHAQTNTLHQIGLTFHTSIETNEFLLSNNAKIIQFGRYDEILHPILLIMNILPKYHVAIAIYSDNIPMWIQ